MKDSHQQCLGAVLFFACGLIFGTLMTMQYETITEPVVLAQCRRELVDCRERVADLPVENIEIGEIDHDD